MSVYQPSSLAHNSDTQAFRVAAATAYNNRRAELVEEMRPDFATFQCRRIARRQDTGECVLINRPKVTKAVTIKPRKSSRFAKLPEGSELIRAWVRGDVPWDAPNDEQIWESALAIANEDSRKPPIQELGFLSSWLNIVLAARVGIALSAEEAER